MGKRRLKSADLTGRLPFRYLVLDVNAATPELIEYVRRTLDMDLISSGGGRELVRRPGRASCEYQSVTIITAKHNAPAPRAIHPHRRVGGRPHHI